jgi:hypothetical protein
MAQYRVIDIENVSDGHGGFEVNDAHYTADTVDLESPTLTNAVKALKAIGRMRPQHQVRHFEIDEHDSDGNLTIRRKRDGYWFYTLEPVRA